VHGSGVRSVFYHIPDQAAASQGPEEKAHCSMKLWIVLEAVFLGVFLALAVLLCLLWLWYNRLAIGRMSAAAQYVVKEFENKTKSVLDKEVMAAQQRRVESIYAIVKDMVADPAQFTKFNEQVHVMQRMTPSPDVVTRSLEVMWPEARAREWYTDFVYYADTSGIFAGFSRDVDGHGALTDIELMYQPPIDASAVSVVCPRICPLNSSLLHGQLYSYYANSRTGEAVEEARAPVKYDVFSRPWFKQAIEHGGKLVWTGPYHFAHRSSLGITAAIAFDDGSGVFERIFAADLAFDIFSARLLNMTRVHAERTFIIQASGEMIASSRGYAEVVRFSRAAMKRTWANETGDPMIVRPLECVLALPGMNGSMANLPARGSMLDDRSDIAFAWARWTPEDSPGKLPYAFFGDWIIFGVQDATEALQNVTALSKDLNRYTAQSVEDTTRFMEMRSFVTIVGCILITVIGAAFLAILARSIVRPLKFISRDMRSLAKLEFMRATDMERGDEEGEVLARHFTDGVIDRSHSSGTDAWTTAEVDMGDGATSGCTSDESSTDDSSDFEHGRRRGVNHAGGGFCPRRCSVALDRGACCRCCRRDSVIGERVRIKEVDEMRNAFNYMSNGIRSFARYMDPAVLQMLVDSNRQAQLGVATVDVTVFFSDIANFTTMAEELDPEDFMKLLGEYLQEMSGVIMRYHGVVGEFIGDAIMAWWNAPVAVSRHTAQALHAALAQQALLSHLRRRWRKCGNPDVRARMGLVRGTVLAGNIGSSARMKFGLVGDSVNLASRLEGLCKRYHVNILIEESARNAEGVEEEFLCRPLDLVIVKGRSNPTEIFELVASRDAVAGTEDEGMYRRYVEEFAAIHELYRAKAFSAALQSLHSYLQVWPKDVPAQMLRERCEALIASPPGEGWTPVEKLQEK